MAATTAEKIAFHAANVARTAPRLEALCGRSEDAARRAGALAERIRRADDRRARLAQAIQAATDVLSLRDCAAGVDAVARALYLFGIVFQGKAYARRLS